MATAEEPLSTIEIGTGTGWMHKLDDTGDTKVEWGRNNPDEIGAAKTVFDGLIKKGYRGYSVRRDGSKGEVLNHFDPSAERIIMALPVIGG